MKKILTILMILVLSIGTVNAGFFSSFINFFTGEDDEIQAKEVAQDTFVLEQNEQVVKNNQNNNQGMDNFKLLGSKVKQKQNINTSLTTTIPLNIGSIYGFSIDAKINHLSNNSLVRFILTDNTEVYQVYESYPRLHGKGIISVNNICEETCALTGFTPTELIVEIINADVEIDGFYYLNNENELVKNVGNINDYKNKIKKAQNKDKIQKLQNNKWTAGETSVSNLTYAEKKKLVGIEGNSILNLQGFEYYKGGVFEVPSSEETNEIETTTAPLSSNYPTSWDWRNRHGQNWHTPIKNQGNCGSCAIFAATGATEHLVNLYYNQHLDLNLAEQDGVSCGGGSCQGAYPATILTSYTNEGVVNEECFPYKAIDASGCNYASCTYTPVTCDQKCTNPTEKVVISGKTNFYSSMGEDALKKMIIDGAVSGGVYSMSHAMAMSGWKTDTDGATIWIFKNSWGSGWGEAGYANLKIDISDIGWTHSLTPEIASTIGNYDIACVDNDNDNYCNWGISAEKPASCPSTCNALKDCDDSNPNLGPFDSSYNCIALEGCQDSDNGLNYNIFGTITGITNTADTCLDDKTLKEYSCLNNSATSTTYECPYLCRDGQCITPSCSDSDGGKNYNTFGIITGNMADDTNEPSDVCLDTTTLQESYCTDNLGYVELYTCPDTCKNGVCTQDIIPQVTITYPSNNSSVTDKFLYITAEATNAVKVDFYINGNSLGSDSSAPYSYKINTRPYSGTNTIKAVATSSTNNQAVDSVTFSLGGDDDIDPEPTPEPTTYACSDGQDNDGDGLYDYNGYCKNKNFCYGADPQCTGPEDTSESN